MPSRAPDDVPLVVESTIDGWLFVSSRRTCPGAFWAVRAKDGRYECGCPARGSCAHTRAAWRHKPLIEAVPIDDEPDWDALEARWFSPGAAS